MKQVIEKIHQLDYLINGVANQDVADRMDVLVSEILEMLSKEEEEGNKCQN